MSYRIDILRKILFGCLSLAVLVQVKAQYTTEFGQNRIQYKNFEWTYYSTTNFDVYYYAGGGEYAKQAIDLLEDEFNNLTDLLGYAPYNKTKIFIFNSVYDLQQSNRGLDGAVFDMGGQTNFTKLQVEIAHPGSMIAFRQEIIYELSRILIEDMMFGGSLAEIFQSSYLLTLPRWFIDGAARYIAYGWDEDMDNSIRDYLGHQRVKRLIKTETDEAGLIGQSIWNYIALTYGKSNISNVLNLTRIIRNEQNSIASTLGIPYKQFLLNWQNHYILQDEEVNQNYNPPEKDNVVASKRSAEYIFSNSKLNNSGSKVAYSKSHLGKYEVFIYDRNRDKDEKIFSGGYKVQGQKIDKRLPLLDWVDEDRLGILYFRRGYLFLSIYNTETGDRVNRTLGRFNQVHSFSFNENGRLAVISGDVDGRSDIFLISMRRNALRRITSDRYDDLDPVFIPGTAAVIFSSNRPADSLDIADINIDELENNFNLFLYDLDTTTYQYTRLTNTLSIDRMPKPKNQYEIYYLSDQKGINNLYKLNLLDSTYNQITNFNNAILDYDISFESSNLSFLMLDDGLKKVYLNESESLDQTIFTPETPRRRYSQAQFVTNLYLNLEPPAPDTIQEDVEAILEELEPEEIFIDPDEYIFEGEEPIDESSNPNFIDTDSYQFERDDSPYRPESFFSNYQKFESKTRVFGPIPYEPRFSFSNLITTYNIDPLRGFGIYFETQISDILENHKLRSGGFVLSDFSSGDFFAEYNYLKYRMDYQLRLDTKTIFIDNDFLDLMSQRYALNSIKMTASFPVTNWFRVEASPMYAWTDFKNLQHEAVINNRSHSDFARDNRVNYVGLNAKAVLDNSIEKGYNMRQGTRGLIEFHHMQATSQSTRSFSRLRFDFRHYQQIHREIVLASRLFYGYTFGPNSPDFLLGGVPNWFLNTTKVHDSDDPLTFSNTKDNTNVLFAEWVTNLRGFRYNELFGSQAILLNTELRIPFFRYITRAPLSSSFLRNFQIIGFYDMGSAWTGKFPLTSKNSVNTIQYDRVGGSTFSAEIVDYRNPWLASYGYGVHTVLLGYHAKIDFAYPIKDNRVGKLFLSVSVGLDF